MESVNLREKFRLFSEAWKPKIIGELNDSYVKAVKIQGEFIWPITSRRMSCSWSSRER